MCSDLVMIWSGFVRSGRIGGSRPIWSDLVRFLVSGKAVRLVRNRGLLRKLVRKQKESPGAPRNSHKLKVIVFTREISLAG